MPVDHTFLAVGEDLSLVLAWLQDLPHDAVVDDRPGETVLYLRDLGEPSDAGESPLIWVTHPRRRRPALWSVGEVSFTPSPIKRFPELHRISRKLREWSRDFALVYSWESPDSSEWSYYLEGSIRHFDVEIYALPEVLEALRKGQYFIHYRDSHALIDKLA